jgi:AraC family transcriptional regulator
MSYDDRLARVHRHIRDNLAGDLSPDRLAEVAALSRFHFHRVFAGVTGETVAEAVRRARLNRAAVLVVTTATPVPVIAARVGYANAQSFARAFRQAFGQTATSLRRRGILPRPLPTPVKGDLPVHPVTIQTAPALHLAALPHRGAYPQIGATFVRLYDLMQATGLIARIAGPGVAVYYDSPADTPAANLRSHAGVVVAPGELPAGFDAVHLPGGRQAVLTLRGPYDGIAAAWDWLYGQWLPQSGEVPADLPPFETYPNSPAETAPADLITEIRMPLR